MWTARLIGSVAQEARIEFLKGVGTSLDIWGLSETEKRETKARIITALTSFNFANLNKTGIVVEIQEPFSTGGLSALDLPIAIGLLKETSNWDYCYLGGYLLAGELSLKGSLLPIRGALPIAQLAHRLGKALILPKANAYEAATVRDLVVYGLEDLGQVVKLLQGYNTKPEPRTEIKTSSMNYQSRYFGNEKAKRTLEVAAAGGFNVLMVGLPGSGKTMLARRLHALLPPMSEEETFDVLQVMSTAGLIKDFSQVWRPFRAPHHTVSEAGLVGGGPFARPGEAALANHGLLFLDEYPEFRRHTLEILKSCLRMGKVSFNRPGTARCIEYGTRPQLLLAMNPCPCGCKDCKCSTRLVQSYITRAAPLRDLVQLEVKTELVKYKDMGPETDDLEKVKAKVAEARTRKLERDISFVETCFVPRSTEHSFEDIARYNTIARTIADMEGSEMLPAHIEEAAYLGKLVL